MRNLWKAGVVMLASVLLLSACEMPFAKNEVKSDPTGSLDEAWANMSEHNSAAYTGKLTIAAESDGVEQVAATIEMDAKYDSSDKDNMLSEHKFDITATSEGMSLEISDAVLRLMGKMAYFNIGDIEIPFTDLAAAGLGDLVDTWYVLDPESEALQELVEGLGEGAGLTGVDATSIESNQITAEQQEKLTKILSEANLFTGVTYDRSDKIDGETVDVLKVGGIDVEGVWAMIVELGDFASSEAESMGQDADEVATTVEELEASKADFVEAMEMVKAEGEIWVGRDDKSVRKMVGTVKIEDGTDVMNLTGELMINNINGTVKVDAPADSEDFMEYISPFIEQYMAAAMMGLDTAGLEESFEDSDLDLQYEDGMTDEELQALIDEALSEQGL